MLNAAVIADGVVENLICVDADNMALFAARGVELVDAAPQELQIGDTTPDGITFYRGGVQLPVEQPPAGNDLLAAADERILELEYENLILKEGLA